MSIVIIGGNECMVCQYEKICKDYGCKAKVFAKEKGCLRKKLGNNIRIARKHSSSVAALTDVLETYCR